MTPWCSVIYWNVYMEWCQTKFSQMALRGHVHRHSWIVSDDLDSKYSHYTLTAYNNILECPNGKWWRACSVWSQSVGKQIHALDPTVSKCFGRPVFLLCVHKTIYTVIKTYIPLLLGQYQTTCNAFSLTVSDTFVGHAFHCMFTMNALAVQYFYCVFTRLYTQSSEHICHYYLDSIKLHVMHLVWQCQTLGQGWLPCPCLRGFPYL